MARANHAAIASADVRFAEAGRLQPVVGESIE
jgi:hypothetical protein